MDHETNNDNQPRMIGTWLECLVSSTRKRTPIEIEALEAKDKAILTLLARLAQHYWRPDFTATQAKHLYADYLHDLSIYSLRDISEAIEKYRQSAEQWFPKSGQLVQIIRTIPSWDIRSAKEHGEILRADADRELQSIVQKIGEEKKRIGCGND